MKKTIAIFAFSALCAVAVSTAQAGVAVRVGGTVSIAPPVYVGPAPVVSVAPCAPVAPVYAAPASCAPYGYSYGYGGYGGYSGYGGYGGYRYSYGPSVVIAPPVLAFRPPFFGFSFGHSHRGHYYGGHRRW